MVKFSGYAARNAVSNSEYETALTDHKYCQEGELEGASPVRTGEVYRLISGGILRRTPADQTAEYAGAPDCAIRCAHETDNSAGRSMKRQRKRLLTKGLRVRITTNGTACIPSKTRRVG